MSYQQRDALVDRIVKMQPSLNSFVRDRSADAFDGSWDLVSYSFERGFEALWDLAKADASGLLQMPLLALWRQSVELAIKSAIFALVDRIDGKLGHNIKALFDQLLAIRVDEGWHDDDELAQNVHAMITLVQSVDPFADRFRYPTDKGGKPYLSVTVDLDELFQAHWIITTWCEGAVMEMRREC